VCSSDLLNVKLPVEAVICAPVVGDMIATVGDNRKLLAFPLAQVPEMGRGKGVRLQRYKDGGIRDACVYVSENGLTWTDSAGRTHTRSNEELSEWLGERAQSGRMVPKGFPRNGKFVG